MNAQEKDFSVDGLKFRRRCAEAIAAEDKAPDSVRAEARKEIAVIDQELAVLAGE